MTKDQTTSARVDRCENGWVITFTPGPMFTGMESRRLVAETPAAMAKILTDWGAAQERAALPARPVGGRE